MKISDANLGMKVMAKRKIYDAPSARDDHSVGKGTIGYVEDVIPIDDLVVVEFSQGRVLLCAPDEVAPA